MKIHYNFEELGKIKNPVVTAGSFDGVHVGHRVIISRLRKMAADISGESVLITFHPHPRRVLYPDSAGKNLLLITSVSEKIRLLEETGLDHLLIINFTPEFAQISSEEFVNEILIDKLRAKIIIVGFNHHFGHNRTGNFEYLYRISREKGFEVEEIPEQDIQNESVSSTRIRKALTEGNIQRANAYLDHLYRMDGKASFNEVRSREFGMNIYDLQIVDTTKLVPPDGVYAVSLSNAQNSTRGMFSISGMSVSNNFLAPGLKLEFHPFEDSLNFDRANLTVFFHKKIREGMKVRDKHQLLKDKREISELIF